ncbi:uncharacterized protein C7orf50-like [Muntiacus reevesi]|uniref:uncharacterized protein C7orf50-like n=1 Tax=Muntiacus reevesi TaxID=9886 RepID=UPI0033070753
MYDRDQVPDEHFPALLAYLEGLRGRARELTVQKAEALMRELDQAGACALPPGGTQRARQVLQLLSQRAARGRLGPVDPSEGKGPGSSGSCTPKGLPLSPDSSTRNSSEEKTSYLLHGRTRSL